VAAAEKAAKTAANIKYEKGAAARVAKEVKRKQTENVGSYEAMRRGLGKLNFK